MQIEIKVPPLAESLTEATLLAWHKQEGESVRRDDNLIDIETDKVVLELPAPADGVLTRIIREDGSLVASQEVIAVLDTTVQPAAATPAEEAAPVAETAAVETAVAAEAPALSPAVRKLVEEQGIDPRKIPGSGPGGRIVKGDVLTYLERAAPASAPSPAIAPSLPGDARPEQRVPMTRLRARVAERLLAARRDAAILTTFNEVNVQAVKDIRARYQEKMQQAHQVRLGFMSFFVQAAVAALKKFPVVNASIDGEDIVYHGYYDIGIAVSSPRGLVVPVLRNADRFTFAETEAGIAEFARKAQDGKLTIEELSGGTFTITNGGVFGSLMSTPILNPPQSAILGMHAIQERPVAENGQVVIRPMMYLALSYDHRLIDGREAVQFLVAMKESLEDPARLLLGL